MAKDSSIEWTNHTWNPWVGCAKVSAGCKNCYMFRDQERFGHDPTNIRRTSRQTFRAPLGWHRTITDSGSPFRRERVFTCSWSDFFLKEADEWREAAWRIIKDTPSLIYQILTKRPERIRECLPYDWSFYAGYPNVWLGVSAEDQETYDERVPALLENQAEVFFVSAEPLLGPIDLGGFDRVGWVITGGESGPDARPMDPAWAKSLRDQCLEREIAFFHKQNGGTSKVDGAWGGRQLDGETWDQFPEGIT